MVLLAFFMPRINAMRIHVIQNKTLPSFPSWHSSGTASNHRRADLAVGERRSVGMASFHRAPASPCRRRYTVTTDSAPERQFASRTAARLCSAR
jgi:hypothetical protein